MLFWKIRIMIYAEKYLGKLAILNNRAQESFGVYEPARIVGVSKTSSGTYGHCVLLEFEHYIPCFTHNAEWVDEYGFYLTDKVRESHSDDRPLVYRLVSLNRLIILEN